MPDHAPLQVFARARAQEIDRVTSTVLLVAEGLAVSRIRLHVVKGGDGGGCVAKGRMAGDVIDPLAADINGAAVAQRFQMLLAGAQHRPLLLSSQNSSMLRAGRERSTCRGTPQQFARRSRAQPLSFACDLRQSFAPMTDALGFLKKFGVIAPSTNTSVQPEFEAMRPRGVTNHFGRIHIPNDPIRNNDDFNQLMDNIRKQMLQAVDDVMTCEPDYLIMGMSSETFWDGLEGSKQLHQR